MRFASVLALMLPGAAAAEMPVVAADIAPVHSLAAMVMQGLGEPALIVPPGASPHAYAMRPSEARALARADLVVWMGASLEPWLRRPIGTLAQGDVLDLLSLEGTVLLPYREEHDDGGQGGGGHEPGARDPHAWLDPENGKLWLAAIAEALARLDPANAAAYRANAEAGRGRIDAAAAEAGAALAPHGNRPLVVYHDAYQYLERRFGLPPAVALSPGDAAAPAPARIAEVAAHLRETGPTCVFAEPEFSPALVAAVAEGAGARDEVLDSLGSRLKPGPDLYPELIRSLGEAIGGCAPGG